MFGEKVFLDLFVPTDMFYTLFLEFIVIVIEAVFIYFLLEKAVGKAFLSSLGANFITGVLSAIYLVFSIDYSHPFYSRLILAVIVPLVVNILVEAGILKLFYKDKTMKRILKTSVVMNLASYIFIVLNIMPLLT
ncbi:hypothetical protein KEJ44_04960 [Candidatus Bathyarchaeota archaeon]|nr:hypothetical protein [Candidatus Bathyarchaeota archaeon]MBS7656288.1 hypothetical protein [Candidatus Bathyarchaeota archaeon]